MVTHPSTNLVGHKVTSLIYHTANSSSYKLVVLPVVFVFICGSSLSLPVVMLAVAHELYYFCVRQKLSVDVIQRNWFSVTSRKSSTAAEVQTYLSAFESIQLPLLFAIVNMADADV